MNYKKILTILGIIILEITGCSSKSNLEIFESTTEQINITFETENTSYISKSKESTVQEKVEIIEIISSENTLHESTKNSSEEMEESEENISEESSTISESTIQEEKTTTQETSSESISSEKPKTSKQPEDKTEIPTPEVKRDAWKQPFSKYSIWNMPVGSGAVLEKANLQRSYWLGVDKEYFAKAKADDPVVDVYSPSNWAKRLPGDKLLGQIQVPDDFFINDCEGSNTPNNCATILSPDGRTYYQLEPACRTPEYKDRIIGWLYSPQGQDLYGDGIGGSHYGSGLSAIGGTIRSGELTSNEPITHALKINVWAEKYLYYGEDVKGFIYPADRCDSYAATTYGGTNPKLTMGTLLVIPQGITPESLGINTEVGKKIFYALQSYGAYVVDDSAWDCYALSVENTVVDEVKEKYGILLTGDSGTYFEDIQKMIENLHIVTNNTKDSIGGGGTPVKPLAPDLE